MARTVRHANTPLNLVDQVLAEGFEFEFSQVLGILEGAQPGCVSLGEGSDPKREAFAVSSRITFGVSASDVQRVWQAQRFRVEVNFLGLAGVNKPLPQPFVELAMERLRTKDKGLQEFWDIFNHRLVSHWFRIQKKYIPGTAKIHPLRTSVGKSFLDISGLFSPDLLKHIHVTPRTLLAYTALLWQRPHSAVGLVRILESYFQLPVFVRQFQSHWQEGPMDQQTQLGGRYAELGKNTVLGRKSWDQADGIEVILGPMRWQAFRDLIPFTPGYKILQGLLLLYCGRLLKVRTRLLVNEIYTLPLGQETRLGYTTWLLQRKDSRQVRPVGITLQSNA